MNKLLIALLLCGVILIAGCTSTPQTTTPSSSDPQTTTQPQTSVNSAPITTPSATKTYECPDGSVVTDINNCPKKQVTTPVPEIKEDKCSPIYSSTKLTSTEIDTEIETCYNSKYIGLAVQNNDTSICNEIVTPSFLGICYASLASLNFDVTTCQNAQDIFYEAKGFYNKLSSRDVCYYMFAATMIDRHLFFEQSYCEAIKNSQLKTECNKFSELIKPAAGINSFYAAKKGSFITSYISLMNAEGSAATADGTAELTFVQIDGYGTSAKETTLYSKSFNVKRRDYELATLGLGGFARNAIIYKFDLIPINSLNLPSGTTSITVKLKFTTTDGSVFTDKTSIYLD